MQMAKSRSTGYVLYGIDKYSSKDNLYTGLGAPSTLYSSNCHRNQRAYTAFPEVRISGVRNSNMLFIDSRPTIPVASELAARIITASIITSLEHGVIAY